MSYARKVDGTQKAIVDRLRSRGAKVEPKLARLGDGIPDLIVGYRGQLALFENKPGDAENRGDRELNDRERKWHEEWAGFPIFMVLSAEAAEQVLDAFDACGHWPRLYRTFP